MCGNTTTANIPHLIIQVSIICSRRRWASTCTANNQSVPVVAFHKNP